MATSATVSKEILGEVVARYPHANVRPITPGRFPFYERVPKEPVEHLRYRRAILRAGYRSPEAARTIWIMCKRDILFWINTFVWTLDPRKPELPPMPFNTWYYQDWMIEWAADTCGKTNGHCDKSRDMGASWMLLMMALHDWWFQKHRSIGILANKWDKVDKLDDPDALLPKLDFVLRYCPKWLKPRYKRKEGQFTNLDSNSTITGEATVENAGRGGRKSWWLVDEAADIGFLSQVLTALFNNTNSVILNSTPQGEDNEFARMRDVTKRRISLHWGLHPDKIKGFKVDEDGKLRSEWYDYKCDEIANPAAVAQELDIDYHGSGFVFFPGEIIEKLRIQHCRAPDLAGVLCYDPVSGEPLRFAPSPHGAKSPWSIWGPLDGGIRPPRDREYVIGVDVSQGTGASNSVISVGDCRTREIVAEYASPNVTPHNLGTIVYAAARWWRPEGEEGALVCYENNGLGDSLRKRVIEELGYTRVWMRREEERLARTLKKGLLPGWASNDDTKGVLLRDLKDAMCAGKIVSRSEPMLREMRTYKFMPTGAIASTRSLTDDPSGAKKNHGDRVIGAGLVWMMMAEAAVTGNDEDSSPEDPEFVPFTFGARKKLHEEKLAKSASW